ncbi:hypothetical protein WA026_023803 [Henosepilachna vigintioctopunctata]|uniref:Uncharacterized protein n=1 Tax=Henosepilachna vigintioctopunctata TaxID=420089 RepID=A0AAW1U0N3_9CUCU
MFGFIVMDGNGVLFGTFQDNTRKVLRKFSMEMPKKQNTKSSREDAQRFTRLKLEIRQNYIENVAKSASELFITGGTPSITNLILAGSGGIKTELSKSSLFDTKLKNKVKFVDVSSGGETGFVEAIKRVGVTLTKVKISQENSLLQTFLDEIKQNRGKYCFGVADTMRGLEMGAVKTVICSEKLNIQRYVLKNLTTGNQTILYLTPKQEKNKLFFTDKESGAKLKIITRNPMMEWLAKNHNTYGATLKVLSKECRESNAQLQNYGGIGGLLRYKVDFQSLKIPEGSA